MSKVSPEGFRSTGNKDPYEAKRASKSCSSVAEVERAEVAVANG